MSCTIAIFAPAGAPTAATIAAALRRQSGVEPLWLDAALGPGQRVTLGVGRVIWNVHDLTTLDAIYVHGFRHEDPVLAPASSETDWTLWNDDSVCRQQKQSLRLSLLRYLETARPVRLVNGPACHLLAFSLPTLLDTLARAGLPVPARMVTSEPGAAADFMKRHGRVAWRPVTGRGAWQLFRERQRRHLVAHHAPPILLAAAPAGRLVRVWVAGSQVLAATEVCSATMLERETLERFKPVDSATPWLQPAIDAVRALGATWAMVVMCVTDDGVAMIYDVDVDPVLDRLPSRLAAILSDGLALQLLDSRSVPASLPHLEEELERPSLLHRRMLAVQFQMEASKARPITEDS